MREEENEERQRDREEKALSASGGKNSAFPAEKWAPAPSWRSDSDADASLKVEAAVLGPREGSWSGSRSSRRSTGSTHLSLSMLLKPGRMCLKLELRSSLGWLLVRFMEPFRRRLRKPWGGVEGGGVKQHHRKLSQCVCVAV